MSSQIGPTTEQALVGAAAGHRMAGMEPSPEAVEITRRFADGQISREQALDEIRNAAHSRANR